VTGRPLPWRGPWTLPLLLAGCVDVPAAPSHDPAAAPFPVFAFFSGPSEGEATLQILFKAQRRVRVRSEGAMQPDGSLRLVQQIEEETRPPRTRHWVIREVAPGRYSGSLTDAEGPFTGEVSGNRLELRYTMPDGYRVHQSLVLAPDGRSAHNVLTVHGYGLTVAALEERITRRDP
jgi:hypothetical protein